MHLLAYDPIDPVKLAARLEVPLLRLSDFAQQFPKEVDRLKGHDVRSEFSAATFFFGRQRAIIYNDRHSPKRRASDLAHELSHCLLLHPPSEISDSSGVRMFNADHEDEANWLGPALLVSEEAAIRIARSGMSVSQASDFFSATEEVVRMRLNVTAAYRRAGLNSRAAE